MTGYGVRISSTPGMSNVCKKEEQRETIPLCCSTPQHVPTHACHACASMRVSVYADMPVCAYAGVGVLRFCVCCVSVLN